MFIPVKAKFVQSNVIRRIIFIFYIFNIVSSLDVVSKRRPTAPTTTTTTTTTDPTEGSGSTCIIVQESIEDAYLGWPHSLPCILLKNNIESDESKDDETEEEDEEEEYNYSYEDDYNVTCVIRDLDSEKVVYKETKPTLELQAMAYNIENMEAKSGLNYELQLSRDNNSKCYSLIIRLNPVKLKDMTCEESSDVTTLNRIPITENNPTQLHCVGSNYDNSPELHKHLLNNYTTIWYRDCQELSTTKQSTPVDSHGDSHHIKRVSFEHTGIYSCAVRHNGMTRFLIRHSLCIYPSTEFSHHSVVCAKDTVSAHIGKQAVIKCYGIVDPNNAKSQTYSVKWKTDRSGEDKEDICKNDYHHRTKPRINYLDPRVSCISHYRFQECFDYLPTEEEREKPSIYLEMQLNLQNVKKSDFGSYTVSLTFIATNKPSVVYATVLLKEASSASTEANVAAAALGFFACILLMGGVVWWHRLIIRVQIKRRFGPYCSDNKAYAAFLSYHFSQDMDKFAQVQTRDAVSMIRDELKNLGYKIFEEYKDVSDVTAKAEGLVECIQQCHRVVIILTSEYLKDHWSIFKLQKAFDEMINSESKLIFVLVPGIMEYIKQHSLHDNTYSVIERAIKINNAIHWSDENSFNLKRFSMLLELAMPKLRSQVATRHSSTSSSTSSQIVHYKNGIKQSMSNDTRTTDLCSPIEIEEESSIEFSANTSN